MLCAFGLRPEFPISVPEHLPLKKSNCHFAKRVYPAGPLKARSGHSKVPTLGMVALATDFSDTASLGLFIAHVGGNDCVHYPAGSGSVASRCTIAPNSRRVRCLCMS